MGTARTPEDSRPAMPLCFGTEPSPGLGNGSVSLRCRRRNRCTLRNVNCNAAKEAIFLSRSLTPIGCDTPTVRFFADNQAAIKLASNPVHHPCSKHLVIQVHKVREVIEDGLLQISHAGHRQICKVCWDVRAVSTNFIADGSVGSFSQLGGVFDFVFPAQQADTPGVPLHKDNSPRWKNMGSCTVQFVRVDATQLPITCNDKIVLRSMKLTWRAGWGVSSGVRRRTNCLRWRVSSWDNELGIDHLIVCVRRYTRLQLLPLYYT